MEGRYKRALRCKGIQGYRNGRFGSFFSGNQNKTLEKINFEGRQGRGEVSNKGEWS